MDQTIIWRFGQDYNFLKKKKFMSLMKFLGWKKLVGLKLCTKQVQWLTTDHLKNNATK